MSWTAKELKINKVAQWINCIVLKFCSDKDNFGGHGCVVEISNITSMIVMAGAGVFRLFPERAFERPGWKACRKSRGVINPFCEGLGFRLSGIVLLLLACNEFWAFGSIAQLLTKQTQIP